MTTRKVFVQGGEVRFVYSDEMMEALRGLGPAEVRRASHVEPTNRPHRWLADMSPVGGRAIVFQARSEALAWEVRELEKMGAPFPMTDPEADR